MSVDLIKSDDAELDRTSSLHKHFICNSCGLKLKTKETLNKHFKRNYCSTSRDKSRSEHVCKWCNVTFSNIGNLTRHANSLHGDKRKNVMNQYFCHICNQTFSHKYLLKFHTRKMHYNLKSKVPYAEMKKVNQVWFEKVLNSKHIVEIKKTGQNTLIMRKLDEKTAIKVNNDATPVIDLTHMYPCKKPVVRVICDFCEKSYNQRDLKKHVDEVHYNMKKYDCNNCKRSFKRLYHYIKHMCDRRPKIKGVKQYDSTVSIVNVESLSLPLGI